jgi:hypothetical protein
MVRAKEDGILQGGDGFLQVSSQKPVNCEGPLLLGLVVMLWMGTCLLYVPTLSKLFLIGSSLEHL